MQKKTTFIKTFKIANTKIHCQLSEPLSECYCTDLKRKRHTKNFCIHKAHTAQQNFTYILFTSGFVNICGIKNLQETKAALTYLCHILKRDWKHSHTFKKLEKDKKIIADNITISGSCTKEIPYDFCIVDQHFKKKQNSIFKTNFNLHFPGLFLKVSNVKSTIILFRNGHFVIVGIRCRADILVMIRNLDAFMKNLFMTSTQEQLSVSFADWY